MTADTQSTLTVREYATFSVKESRQIFRGHKRLHRRWGSLYCEADGLRWTLLGDYVKDRRISPDVITRIPHL